jgi:hypothetical protein
VEVGRLSGGQRWSSGGYIDCWGLCQAGRGQGSHAAAEHTLPHCCRSELQRRTPCRCMVVWDACLLACLPACPFACWVKRPEALGDGPCTYNVALVEQAVVHTSRGEIEVHEHVSLSRVGTSGSGQLVLLGVR